MEAFLIMLGTTVVMGVLHRVGGHQSALSGE